jgi:hypothetical protein
MNFRKTPLYRGEYFVALTIPKDEDPLVVPCDCKVNADGSFRLVYSILYAYGDLNFAYERARLVLRKHPTWKAGLYRKPDRDDRDSSFQAEIRLPECGGIISGCIDCSPWSEISKLGQS